MQCHKMGCLGKFVSMHFGIYDQASITGATGMKFLIGHGKSSPGCV